MQGIGVPEQLKVSKIHPDMGRILAMPKQLALISFNKHQLTSILTPCPLFMSYSNASLAKHDKGAGNATKTLRFIDQFNEGFSSITSLISDSVAESLTLVPMTAALILLEWNTSVSDNWEGKFTLVVSTQFMQSVWPVQFQGLAISLVLQLSPNLGLLTVCFALWWLNEPALHSR